MEIRTEVHDGREVEVRIYRDVREHIPWGERTWVAKLPSSSGLKYYRAGLIYYRSKTGGYEPHRSNFQKMMEDIAQGIFPDAHSTHRDEDLEK